MKQLSERADTHSVKFMTRLSDHRRSSRGFFFFIIAQHEEVTVSQFFERSRHSQAALTRLQSLSKAFRGFLALHPHYLSDRCSRGEGGSERGAIHGYLWVSVCGELVHVWNHYGSGFSATKRLEEKEAEEE